MNPRSHMTWAKAIIIATFLVVLAWSWTEPIAAHNWSWAGKVWVLTVASVVLLLTPRKWPI
jgi:hypothetical protein